MAREHLARADSRPVHLFPPCGRAPPSRERKGGPPTADTRDRLTKIRNRAALDQYRDSPQAAADIDWLLDLVHILELEVEAVALAALDPDN